MRVDFRCVCVPDVKPPVYEPLDCEVARPLLRRSCEHAWRERLIRDAIRCPQNLCFEDVKMDTLETVARVSTFEVMRVLNR